MISRRILAAFFIIAGSYHFASPGTYLPMMPGYLPWHLPLIYLSGLAEMIGGIGILIPELRKPAGWWLVGVLIAVFPANIQMLTHGAVIGGHQVPQWILIARLPLQLLMIAWVGWSCIRGGRKP